MPNTQNSRHLLVMIVAMSVVGLMATDIYIPVMPSIAQHFGISSQMMQFTLGSYLLGLSLAQLVYGPLSEQYGRRPVVLVGMLVFTAATLACSLSSSGQALILCRFLQGVGACAGLTMGRAMIGDVYPKQETARIFATIFPVIGLSPAIAPVLGGAMNSALGWHSVFWLVFALAFVLFFILLFRLPETKDKNNLVAFNLTSVIGTYASILGQRTFWAYALIPCFANVIFYGYISESSFVFVSHGYSPSQIGSFYIAISLSYLAGNLLSRKLIERISLSQALLWGYMIAVTGALAMLVTNMIGDFYAIKIWLPVAALALGNGFLMPLGTAGVIGNFKEKAGYASAILGFVQLGSASCSALAVGLVSHEQAVFLALYLAICCLAGFLAFVAFFARDLAGTSLFAIDKTG